MAGSRDLGRTARDPPDEDAWVERRRRLREERSRSVVEALKCWAMELKVLQQSSLGRAMRYLLYDLFQWALGVCAGQDLALSVLTTVIGVAVDRRRLIVDAGALTLSKDHSAARLKAELGYGCLLDPAGQPLGDLRLVRLDQEHRFVEPMSQPLPDLRGGDKVRILPSHACMTAACFAEYQVIDGAVDEGEVVERWPRLSGWYPP